MSSSAGEVPLAEQAHDVFLSYRRTPEARRRVRELAAWLRARGVDAWIDSWSPRPEDDWYRWSERQIDKARRVLVVVDPDYHACTCGAEGEGGNGVVVEWKHIYTRAVHRKQSTKVRAIWLDSAHCHVDLPILGPHQLVETAAQREQLLRDLLGLPEEEPPPLGEALPVPEDEHAGSQDWWWDLYLSYPPPGAAGSVTAHTWTRDLVLPGLREHLLSRQATLRIYDPYDAGRMGWDEHRAAALRHARAVLTVWTAAAEHDRGFYLELHTMKLRQQVLGGCDPGAPQVWRAWCWTGAPQFHERHPGATAENLQDWSMLRETSVTPHREALDRKVTSLGDRLYYDIQRAPPWSPDLPLATDAGFTPARGPMLFPRSAR